jgi:hypothetical protein
MTTIETNTKFTFKFAESKPLLGVVLALLERGISPSKVSDRIERVIAGDCTANTLKASKSAKSVSVAWKPRKDDGGKTTVKLAGARFELGDSPEARFVEICTRIEGLAAMYCRFESVKLPEAILRHFAANDCCFATKEQAEEASNAYKATANLVNS